MGRWNLLRKHALAHSHEYTTDHTQAGDGSRQPSALELEIATIQGEQFGHTVSKVNFA